MTDLTDTDFPPPEPQPFVTEEGREIQRLRDELSKKIGELAAAIKERDEARQEVCRHASLRSIQLFGVHHTPKEHAAERGWDCFKEGGGA